MRQFVPALVLLSILQIPARAAAEPRHPPSRHAVAVSFALVGGGLLFSAVALHLLGTVKVDTCTTLTPDLPVPFPVTASPCHLDLQPIALGGYAAAGLHLASAVIIWRWGW
jgi:hypothetical protein